MLKNINRKQSENKAHRHRFQEIIYIKKGEGSHFIDDNTIKLRERSFYLISMNQVHGFNYGKDLEGTLIRFQEDFLPVPHDNHDILRDYVNTIMLKNEIQLSSAEANKFEALLELLLDEFNSRNPRKEITLQNLLFALLNKLTAILLNQLQQDPAQSEGRDRYYFNKFNLLSAQHFTKEHSVGFYSNALGISSRRLSSICQRFSGKTAKSIIIEKIISELKRYLKFSSLSFKEIAYRLGFEDPAYMSRIFKKLTDKTLTEYRHSNQRD